MFNKRQISILELFLNEEYLGLEVIAEQLSISTRTVSREIQGLKPKLYNYNLDLEHNYRYGYKLIWKDENDVINLKKRLQINDKNNLELKILLTLLSNESTTISEIADKYYCSDYQVSNSLENIEKLISNYNLRLVSKPYYGFYILGSEENIRELIIDNYIVYYNNTIVKTLLPENDIECLNLIKKLIKEHLVINKIILSDLDFSNLVALIIVSAYRYKNFPIRVESTNYNDIVKDIVLDLNMSSNQKLGLNEIGYISNNTILGNDKEYLEKRILYVVEKSSKDIDENNPNYYNFDQSFRKALFMHINLLIKRRNINTGIVNPLLKFIKKDYIVEFNDAIILANNIKTEFNIDINDDELGYLAIHLGASKRQKYSKKRAIIICNYGIGTSQLVKEKIESEYDEINIIGIYPTVYLDVAISQNPDFIITTVPLTEYNYDIPLIYIENILFNSEDIVVSNNDDRFLELFNKNLFYDYNFKSKDEFLNKILTDINEETKINLEILHSVLEREEVSSTAIGNLVAIPHTIKRGDFNSFIAIGRNKRSIQWDDEKEEVRLIFIIILNQKDINNIEILKDFYRKISNVHLITKLLRSKNYEEFIKIISMEDLNE